MTGLRYARRLAVLGAVAGLALLGGCGDPQRRDATRNLLAEDEAATPEPTPTPAQAAIVVDAQEFADRTASIDAFIVATSELAAKQPMADPVRAYARSMIEEHGRALASLKSAMARLDPPLTPDAAMPMDMRARLDALRDTDGDTFTGAYLRAQVAAHEAVMVTLQSYAVSGDIPTIKALARERIPEVNRHLVQARELERL